MRRKKLEIYELRGEKLTREQVGRKYIELNRDLGVLKKSLECADHSRTLMDKMTYISIHSGLKAGIEDFEEIIEECRQILDKRK